MNYNVGGISRSLSEWATVLGISETAMRYELRRGRQMTDIVQQYQVDTFSAKSDPIPPRPKAVVLVAPQVSTFTSIANARYGEHPFNLGGDCGYCMSKAREFYDAQHAAHTALEGAGR